MQSSNLIQQVLLLLLQVFSISATSLMCVDRSIAPPAAPNEDKNNMSFSASAGVLLQKSSNCLVVELQTVLL